MLKSNGRQITEYGVEAGPMGLCGGLPRDEYDLEALFE
jgi:hypothetical protein